MKLIAHRGNINGPDRMENSPSLIYQTLGQGYDAEIDVWYLDGKFWLGHDEPYHSITETFLYFDGLWCHAKNHAAMVKMMEMKVDRAFWHQSDDFALTTSNHFWVYPGKMTDEMKPKGIAVMPETICAVKDLLAVTAGCFGVCSDYVKAIHEKQIAHF